MPQTDLAPLPEPVATRPPRPSARVEVELDRATAPALGEAEPIETDDTGEVVLPLLPGQRAAHAGAVVLIDDQQISGRANDPVIGPRIEAARHRRGWSIDDLAERTAIRPHLLEALEEDDFGPCGGDFYARGHLRAVADVLDLPGDDLVWEYDTLYAGAPFDARQIFEAELAGAGAGGALRSTTGPRWGMLATAVIALALVWGLARTFTDQPTEVAAPSPSVDQAGLAAQHQPITSAKSTPRRISVQILSPNPGAMPNGTTSPAAAPTPDSSGHIVLPKVKVVVRDRTGQIMFAGRLRPGTMRTLVGLAPFTVKTSDATAVRVRVAGHDRGTVGTQSGPGRGQFR